MTDGCEGTAVQYRSPRQAQAGRRSAGRGGESHARSQGPQCRHRQEVRLADRHQGRRHRRQGNRAGRPYRKHGRPDGEGSRHQDLRRRRRRHHHRHRAGRSHLQRRPQERRRRRQPDADEAGHREGRRGRHRGAQEALDPVRRQEGDGPGRHHRREQRQRDRQPDRRGDGEGRQGRRHHRRRRQEPRDQARVGRGHAVRPRLPLALLRHRSGEDGGRARRRLRPDPREEDLGDQGPGPGAREGGPERQAAADHRRRRRRRSPRHAGDQQAPRHAQGRGREGPGLRRPPQGDARDIAILTGGQAIFEELGIKLENATLNDLGRAKKVIIDKDNTTIIEGKGKENDIKGRIDQIKPRSTRPPATTTGRSSRSGWPSSPAAWP